MDIPIQSNHKSRESEKQRGETVHPCVECGSKNFKHDYHSAEIICKGCGLVVTTKIVDKGPEWSAFTFEQQEKRARAGGPMTFTIHDKGLSTIIDRHNRDVHGNRLPVDQKAQIYRIRKWHQRIRVSDSSERSLAFALSEIKKITERLNLPWNIVESASVIYRRAVKRKRMRGRSIQSAVAAAIYIACRQSRIARTWKEVVRASHVKSKQVYKGYRHLLDDADETLLPFSPRQYLSKFSEDISFNVLRMDLDKSCLISADNNP